MKARTRRLGLALAAGALVGALVPSVVVPTVAAWVDLGGAQITLNAIDEPPPETVLPIAPVAPGTTTVPETEVWAGPNFSGDPAPTIFCYSIEVRTSSDTLAPWTMLMRTNQPPFNGVAQGNIFPWNTNMAFTPDVDYTTNGEIVVTPAFDTQWASVDQGYLWAICVVNTPLPDWQPPGDDTYEQISTTLVRNGSQPCVALTVTGFQPFYVGFTGVFDWQAILDAQATPAEKTAWLGLTHWDGAAPGFPNGSTGATGTDYLTTLSAYDFNYRVVSNYNDVTISSCAY